MKKPNIYCYCDFSVSDKNVGPRVKAQLVELCDELDFEAKFVSLFPKDDQGWTGNICNEVNKLNDDEYIFIWFDDLLINPSDLIQAVSKALNYIAEFPYVRVTGRPPPIGREVGKDYRIISSNECYQSSLVGSLWSVSYFKKMINVTDSPWSVEHQRHPEPELGVGSTIRLKMRNAKIKGKDNIFDHPNPIYSWANITASVKWEINNSTRNILVNFPVLYHRIISISERS